MESGYMDSAAQERERCDENRPHGQPGKENRRENPMLFRVILA